VPITTIIPIPIQDVRVGDLAHHPKHGPIKVTRIAHGPKWVILSDEHDGGRTIIRRQIGELVTVTRTEDTEEEKEAQLRAHYNDMILRFVEHAESDWEAAQAEFAEKIRGGFDPDHGYSFIYSKLMYAHATHALKVELVQLYEGINRRRAENPDEQGGFVEADWVHVWGVYREDKIEKLIDYGHRGNSRSTSQVSNILEDIQNEVIANAIRRHRYPH
jgi:hypothetical protein